MTYHVFIRFISSFALVVFVCFGIVAFGGDVFANPSPPGQSTTQLTNPIGSDVNNPKGTTDLKIILGKAIATGLGVIGAITLVVFIVGGAYWLVSFGNAERVKKGTQTMVWAGIGLFVVFGAYGLLYTFLSGLRGAALVPPSSSPTPTVQTNTFFQVGSTTVTILGEPRTNATPRGTINATIPCVIGTGKAQDPYIEVVDPANPQLIGWVEKSGIRQMSQDEIAQEGCQGATVPILATQSCVCTGSVHIVAAGGLASCNIDDTVSYPLNTILNTHTLLISFLDKHAATCSGVIRNQAVNFIEDRTYSLTAEQCQNIVMQGEIDESLVLGNYNITCKVE